MRQPIPSPHCAREIETPNSVTTALRSVSCWSPRPRSTTYKVDRFHTLTGGSHASGSQPPKNCLGVHCLPSHCSDSSRLCRNLRLVCGMKELRQGLYVYISTAKESIQLPIAYRSSLVWMLGRCLPTFLFLIIYSDWNVEEINPIPCLHS